MNKGLIYVYEIHKKFYKYVCKSIEAINGSPYEAMFNLIIKIYFGAKNNISIRQVDIARIINFLCEAITKIIYFHLRKNITANRRHE